MDYSKGTIEMARLIGKLYQLSTVHERLSLFAAVL